MAVEDSSGIIIGKATYLFKENGKQSLLLMSLDCLSFLTDLYSKLVSYIKIYMFYFCSFIFYCPTQLFFSN